MVKSKSRSKSRSKSKEKSKEKSKKKSKSKSRSKSKSKMLYLFSKTFKQKANIYWITRNTDSDIDDEVLLSRQRLMGGDIFLWDSIPISQDRTIDVQFESVITTIKFFDAHKPKIVGPYIQLISQSQIPKEFRIDPDIVQNSWIFLISDVSKKNVVEDAPVSTVRRPKKQPVISRVVTEKALQHRLSPYFGQNGLTGKRNGEKFVNKTLDKQSDPIVNDLIHKHIQTVSGANL